MGGKHGKYVYVKLPDGWYIKVRVFKGRLGEKEDYSNLEPEAVIPVGPKVKEPPFTFKVVDIEEFPEEVRKKIYQFS
ncbi:MAG: DUF5622 domain-containing protein [Desulfurococcales archaeon]|nr:DUF5622 domain-containing protein [Desulfurococcales archaeon]